MKTQLDKSFEVPQSTDLVWEHLIDPEKIMDCVPGVTIDEKVGDNHYKGKVGMKFGPMGVKYDADIHYNEIDKANRKIIITGEGVDSKGNGNAEMMMTIDLIERAEGGVKLDAIMDVTINGKIAQFGSRLITTVSNQLFKQFVSNFSKKLAAAEAATSA
ncbi:CoxG family protein [uncultured Eudoraea sp.]|jgi:carbon monoxide dehydrogenase subunit G|uniref:CoxG family protein n=1 Tax=uncultured Eudoraea sp. TaxID=1035614 RepID=UPI002630728D|nr:SRPBCC family protein [uncultured Eudoraea sp.]